MKPSGRLKLPALLMIALSTLLIQPRAAAQQEWMPVASGTGRILYGVGFRGALGFAVGVDGTILRSRDAGITWHQVFGGTDDYFYDVAVLDSATVVVCGEAGVVMRSTDGGDTWRLQRTYLQGALRAIHFRGRDTGVIAGGTDVFTFGHSLIIGTTDGGEHWAVVDSGRVDALFAMAFSDDLHGACVAGYGGILTTADGGLTWQQRENPAIDTYHVFYGISFGTRDTGYIVGTRDVLITTDGGVNWRRIRSWEISRPFYDVAFLDGHRGVAVGFTPIESTADGGTTWRTEDTSTAYAILGVALIDAETAVAVGSFGTILRTVRFTSGITPPVGSAVRISVIRPVPSGSGLVIRLRAAERAGLRLEIVDILGRPVATVLDAVVDRGVREIQWDAAGAASGKYFCRVVDRDTGALLDIQPLLIVR